MKFLVIGCGSIGKRHITNLKALGIDVCISDKDSEVERKVAGERGVDRYTGAQNELDAYIICTPPSSHISLARQAIDSNKSVFIEKPISDTLDGVDDLLREADSRNLIVSVGYQLRFNESLQIYKELIGKLKLTYAKLEFSQFLGDWRPQQDYRSCYTADLGIILDGSHEIHYAMWLFGKVKGVICYAEHLLGLKGEDSVEMILEFRNGVVAHIHLNMVDKGYIRRCLVRRSEGDLVWEYQKNNDDYIAEMQHFINCIQGKEKPLVDGYTAREVLKVALAAKESNEEWIEIV